MADIPRAVLSEHFEERLRGRRLVAAVFLTFRFDPEFFEQEILPVFLNIPVSHAAAIKLVQLEDALRSISGGIAVYYDQNGLVPEGGPAKLDVMRVALRHRTGIFHPKNVFALIEDAEPDEEGHRSRTLLVASLSANLTRAGWWENVEVCHVEEIEQWNATRLRDDVIMFLEGLERRVGEKASGHSALRQIRSFLQSSTELRLQRSSAGVLHTHFYDGRRSVPDFLQAVAGSDLGRMNLEIISPYFDKGPESAPLQELIARFSPREVRVCLPRNDIGEALCSPALFDWLRAQPNVSWGRLPQDIMRVGKREDAGQRMVHAKVYRFFSLSPKREILFIGSANLTASGHQSGGNLETGFLAELSPNRKPDWWLVSDVSRPGTYASTTDEGASTLGGSRLSVRFHWDSNAAAAFWDDSSPSPALTVSAQNVPIFSVAAVPSRRWHTLPEQHSAALRRILVSTSILKVEGEGKEPGLILVQEEGMQDRPSLLFELSPAEILRYWSLLTAAQRAAFHEARPQAGLLTGEGAQLIAPCRPLVVDETFFDRFAGIFLAFGCLERGVRAALAEGRTREALYRVFGQKYDSLGNLLERVIKDTAEDKGDLVEHYVMALSAQQLVQELRRDHPDFWREHAEQAGRLDGRIAAAVAVRERLIGSDAETMGSFLGWFDRWFLSRATPVTVEAS